MVIFGDDFDESTVEAPENSSEEKEADADKICSLYGSFGGAGQDVEVLSGKSRLYVISTSSRTVYVCGTIESDGSPNQPYGR